jgi:hemerythrin HHE cation binding domain-containing protein
MTIQKPTSQEREALALAQREGWPAEMRVLIEKYPRDTWSTHQNLGQMAQFWLQRHDMFRELGTSLDQATARFREGQMPPVDFARWLAPRLQFFLEQLHVHHRIEDGHYFPIFRDADARLARGFDVLENDHGVLHHDIDRSVVSANALLGAIGGEADALKRAGDDYASAGGDLLRGLRKHLDDEEDLIVPLILERGEDKLGVGH